MTTLMRRAGSPFSLKVGCRAFLAGLIGAAVALMLSHGPARAADSEVPRFVVDPYWPKPLPNRWVTGAVGGICVDREDHVFGVNRSDLTAMEQTVGKEPAPVVIEYDSDGNIVNAWGDPKQMPKSVPGCFVDGQDNIWIGGNADGIVQKWSHDGKQLLLQIGRKGVCDNADEKCGEPGANKSPLLLNEPADIAIDPGISMSPTATATTASSSSTPKASSCVNGVTSARIAVSLQSSAEAIPIAPSSTARGCSMSATGATTGSKSSTRPAP
jgi:hypothetical protein